MPTYLFSGNVFEETPGLGVHGMITTCPRLERKASKRSLVALYQEEKNICNAMTICQHFQHHLSHLFKNCFINENILPHERKQTHVCTDACINSNTIIYHKQSHFAHISLSLFHLLTQPILQLTDNTTK